MKETKYENRPRWTLEEIQAGFTWGAMVSHCMNNGDGTYSIVSHIVCEHCDYCEWDGAAEAVEWPDHLAPVAKLLGPFPAKADIYENQKREVG